MKNTTNAVKANKTSTPLSQKTKELLDTKVVTKTTRNMPKRSTLRSEKKPDSTFCSTTTDGDQELQRKAQTGDWVDPKLSDKQPLSGPGHTLTKQELGIMPEDTLGTADRKLSAQIPSKKTTTAAPVKGGGWTHQYDKG